MSLFEGPWGNGRMLELPLFHDYWQDKFTQFK